MALVEVSGVPAGDVVLKIGDRDITGPDVLAAEIRKKKPGQEVTLKIHHFLPPVATIHAQVFDPWCAKIAKESACKLKCQIYPAMQLGGTPPQLFDQAKDGVVDIVWTLPGYTAGRFPRIEVFELPFMITDAESASRAAWQFYEKHGRSEFREVRPLAIHVHDAGYLHMRERVRGGPCSAAQRGTDALDVALHGGDARAHKRQVAGGAVEGVDRLVHVLGQGAHRLEHDRPVHRMLP